jgi:general secretion pathway protein G
MAGFRQARRTHGATRGERPGGFTLVELLAVVLIVAILAAAARPLLTLTARRSQEHDLRAALRQIRNALDAHKRASDIRQIEVAPQASGYPSSLRALVDGVPLAARPEQRVYFLRRLPRDPFADPRLPPEQTWALRSSDSPADRPTAGRDVFDVMSRSEQRAIDGSRYGDW